MINCALILKPAIDKAALHRCVEPVTQQNYLRETDERDYRDHCQEVVSILNSYGYPHNAETVVPLGFVFAGAAQLVNQIPSIVQGQVLSNQDCNGLLGSVVIIATIEQWQAACGRPVGDVHLENCFKYVAEQLRKLTPSSHQLRLN